MDQRPGMDFHDVRKRVVRISRMPGDPEAKSRLMGSMINQAGVREGEAAKKELAAIANRVFSCAGNKQVGYGPGHKLGDGSWRYIDGKWERL